MMPQHTEYNINQMVEKFDKAFKMGERILEKSYEIYQLKLEKEEEERER